MNATSAKTSDRAADDPSGWGTRVAKFLSFVAGLSLLALTLLTVADVLSRNLLNKSILGTVEISTLLLVAVAFVGLASAELEGRHVSVELFEMRLGPRFRLVLSLLRIVLLVALGLVITWGLVQVLDSALNRGETTNDILRLPTWPAKIVLVISFGAFFVAAVWTEVTEFLTIRGAKEGDPR